MRVINPMICPHYIIAFEHYRADGSCKCNDPNESVMAEWGYVWDNTSQRWESPPEEEDVP